MLLLIAALGNCTREEPPPTFVQDEETARMVRLLNKIARESNVQQSTFLNREKIGYLERQEQPKEGWSRVRRDFRLGQQYLFAGETEKALEILSDVREKARLKPAGMPDTFSEAALSMLAIAQMRLGEQDNCLTWHNPDACIFPIQGRGIHQSRRGSAAAIPIYQEILERNPANLNARWLLNLAHMTLGGYPEQVPKAWLIAPELFQSDFQIPRFHDIAKPTQTAINKLAGSVIAEDFNNDGLLDILSSSWGLGDQLHYLHNTGKGRFEERTEAAGLVGIVGGLNMVQADFDNDGWIDVLVLRGAWRHKNGLHPNSLLKNNRGVFVDVTESSGLLDFSPTQTAAWGDFDRDGHMDLFVGNESSTGNIHPCTLFRNQGDGTFIDVTQAAKLYITGYVKGVIWGDVNNDGLPDLYLSRLDMPNVLLRNDGPNPNGGWQFTDITESAGVGEPLHSFPTWFFDYDNDGWLDLFVSGYGRDFQIAAADAVAADYLGLPAHVELPRLYRNSGNGRFEDVTEQTGLKRAFLTMGCGFGDLDNDGWLDFYLGTGAPDFQALVPNLMFRNDLGQRFQNVTTAGGFGHLQKGHGIAFADLDNDGDQDIYAVMGGAYSGDFYPNALFENPGFDNRWLTLHLVGRQSSRDAIGARLKVRIREGTQSRDIYGLVSSGGSFGATSLRQELGLGRAEQVEFLEIDWPVSGKQRLQIQELNQAYRIVEGEPHAEKWALPSFRFSQEPSHH